MGNIYSFFSEHGAVVDVAVDRLLDPRSPLAARTPLARLTSSKKRPARQDIADPRSPTMAFRRTPLVQHDVDYMDPRSPMAGRTPVRRLTFDAHDPREADRARTPLAYGRKSLMQPRRLIEEDDVADEFNDSVHSALDESTEDIVALDDHELSMNSVIDDDDNELDDDDFEEVDLDEQSHTDVHEKTATDDWAAQLTSSKPTMRYMMLSPKHKRTPRLSLCAGVVRGAIARAVQSARTTRHMPALAATPCDTPIAMLMLRPDDDDDESSCCATPPSPFTSVRALRMGGLRLASSCPSSPAA